MTTKSATLGQINATELTRRAAKALAGVDEITSTLPPLFALTTQERRTSNGRLRDGEEEALLAVLDVADHVPEAFRALGADGGGLNHHETGRLRDALKRGLALDELVAALEELTRMLRDSQLVLSGDARRSVLAAYPIAKAIATHDDVARTKLAPALNYYAAPARLAARRRRDRKQGGQAP